jgi:hypothetical protein
MVRDRQACFKDSWSSNPATTMGCTDMCSSILKFWSQRHISITSYYREFRRYRREIRSIPGHVSIIGRCSRCAARWEPITSSHESRVPFANLASCLLKSLRPSIQMLRGNSVCQEMKLLLMCMAWIQVEHTIGGTDACWLRIHHSSHLKRHAGVMSGPSFEPNHLFAAGSMCGRWAW